MPTDSSPATVQSVARALTILEVLAESGEADLGQIAAALDVHKSTASRLLATLAAHGLVEQPEPGRAVLGVGIVRLGGAASARLDLVQQARPVCQELAARTNETVNVAVLRDAEVLYLDQVIGASTITSYNWVGQRVPLHATASGRVLAAALSESERRAAWGRAQTFTDTTVTDPQSLEELVRQARDEGYAVVREELDLGLVAVAAPVRNAHGEIAASVSVSGPSFRMDDHWVEAVLPPLRQAAAESSARLGWHG